MADEITISNEEDHIGIHVRWAFDDPHEAGHLVGQLIKVLAGGFAEQGRDREEITDEILSGLMCMVDTDGDSRIKKH